MPLLNLADIARDLPDTWKSRVLAQAGACNIKVLKMDGQASPAETHDYNEALIVISGVLRLSVQDEDIEVAAGDMYLAPAGIAHAVAQGSHGVLMIIDPIGS